jgi:hypothetical protein
LLLRLLGPAVNDWDILQLPLRVDLWLDRVDIPQRIIHLGTLRGDETQVRLFAVICEHVGGVPMIWRLLAPHAKGLLRLLKKDGCVLHRNLR